MDALTRRRFLLFSGVAGAGALAAGGTAIAWNDLTSAAASRPLPPGSGVLVVVTMYGGNDGLNTVVPAADPAYRSARPNLALPESSVLDLGDGLGLNPSMPNLHGLWGARKLAIVRGVGYPNPILSHFSSMDIWQTASPLDPSTTGWLGRWLDAADHDPLKAVAIGPVLPPLLAGATNSGASLPLGALRLPEKAAGQAFTGLGAPQSADSPLQAEAARTDADLVTVAQTCGPVLKDAATPSAAPTAASTPSSPSTPSATPTASPTGRSGRASGGGGRRGALADQLAVVSACIKARVPTRVYAVDIAGFDTHTAEKGTQDDLLAELDTAVSGFLKDISGAPNGPDTVVLMYSEFGRRVTENANEGTDHGTAGPVLVAGTPIKGGFQGDQPSLTALTMGNLNFTTDFRSVYATLLTNVLDADPARVLGQDYPQLSFL